MISSPPAVENLDVLDNHPSVSLYCRFTQGGSFEVSRFYASALLVAHLEVRYCRLGLSAYPEEAEA